MRRDEVINRPSSQAEDERRVVCSDLQPRLRNAKRPTDVAERSTCQDRDNDPAPTSRLSPPTAHDPQMIHSIVVSSAHHKHRLRRYNEPDRTQLQQSQITQLKRCPITIYHLQLFVSFPPRKLSDRNQSCPGVQVDTHNKRSKSDRPYPEMNALPDISRESYIGVQSEARQTWDELLAESGCCGFDFTRGWIVPRDDS